VSAKKAANMFAAISFFLTISILIFHLNACVWMRAGIPHYPGEQTWFTKVGYDYDESHFEQGDFNLYLDSLYYVAVSVTSTGYGDIFGYSIREYCFSMYLEVLGLAFNVYLISKLKGFSLSATGDIVKQNQVTLCI
jgi:hypothetical protein